MCITTFSPFKGSWLLNGFSFGKVVGELHGGYVCEHNHHLNQLGQHDNDGLCNNGLCNNGL